MINYLPKPRYDLYQTYLMILSPIVERYEMLRTKHRETKVGFVLAIVWEQEENKDDETAHQQGMARRKSNKNLCTKILDSHRDSERRKKYTSCWATKKKCPTALDQLNFMVCCEKCT